LECGNSSPLSFAAEDRFCREGRLATIIETHAELELLNGSGIGSMRAT